MKKIVVFSVVVIATLTLSGCGDSVKSVEEYSKLEKAELGKMLKECENKFEKIFDSPEAWEGKGEADRKSVVRERVL